MIGLRTILALGIASAFTSCATPKTFAPDQAPEYMIIRNYTPFYRFGPMQRNGPNASLPAQTRVKLLSQDMGYSRVQLEDDRTGYVANDYMAVAPPRPPEPRESLASADTGARSGNKKRGASAPRYRGEQVNDTPLPDRNVPPPDLNIAPEEVPAATTAPTPPPEKPKFRF